MLSDTIFQQNTAAVNISRQIKYNCHHALSTRSNSLTCSEPLQKPQGNKWNQIISVKSAEIETLFQQVSILANMIGNM